MRPSALRIDAHIASNYVTNKRNRLLDITTWWSATSHLAVSDSESQGKRGAQIIKAKTVKKKRNQAISVRLQ